MNAVDGGEGGSVPVQLSGEVVDDVDDLQALYDKEIRRKPYTFRWADRQWTLPALADLDIDVQDEIEKYEGNADGITLDRVHDLFGRIFGEQAADWRATVKSAPFVALLFQRWLKHSGRKPGEDEASPGSSTSTARPSKRTSGASTGSGSPKRSTAKRATPKAGSRRASSST